MINGLIRLANHLDLMGCTKEADRIDHLIKISQDQDLLIGGGGISKEWDEQKEEPQTPAPTYSVTTDYGLVQQELRIECPAIREEARSSHGKGLAEWQMIVVEVDPRQQVYVPVKTTGRGVLDIFVDKGDGDIREAIYVEPEPGIRVKTRSRSRVMVNVDLSSRLLSLGRYPESNTRPIDSGFTIKNRSYDQKIRVKVEGACFPEECVGRRCQEWVISNPQERRPQTETKPQETRPQAETDPPREPIISRPSEEIIDEYDLYPGDAVDEIILSDDFGEWA